MVDMVPNMVFSRPEGGNNAYFFCLDACYIIGQDSIHLDTMGVKKVPSPSVAYTSNAFASQSTTSSLGVRF